MDILRSLRSFFRRVIRKIRRALSKKELLILVVFIVGVVIAASIIIVLKINTHRNDPEGGSGLDISIEGSSQNDGDEDSDNNDSDIVERASSATKIESTEETTVLAAKEGAGEGYLNRCVFLGDSRTVAMVNYGLINDDSALAQIGISHPSFKSNTFINNAGKQYTLKSYLSSHQAPVIYIALGVNGINDPSKEHYKSTFEDLISTVAELSPDSNIVLMSIGPVNDNGAYKKTVQNSNIVYYNDFLLNTAKSRHLFYLDISEILTGDDGQVRSEYNAGDGLHYNSSGCKAIFDYIVSHPVPGISDEGEYVVHYVKPNPNNTKITMDEGSGIDESKLTELMNMMMEETPQNPTATITPTPTATPVLTSTTPQDPTVTPEATRTPTPSPTPESVNTSTPAPTPDVTSIPTQSVTPTPVPTQTQVVTEAPAPTAAPADNPTSTPVEEPTPTEEAAPTPVEETTPTPDPNEDPNEASDLTPTPIVTPVSTDESNSELDSTEGNN